jgi:hypothetical protein
MKHLHLIKVKYISATDFKGTRVKLTSTRHNKSKIIPFDYKFNNAMEVAKDYIKNDLKYTIKATCNLDSNDCIYGILVQEFSEFKPEDKVLDENGNRLY